jgi:hypothetical protein
LNGYIFGKLFQRRSRTSCAGVFRVRVIRQQGAREAIDIIALPLAENLEFTFAYHRHGIQRARSGNCYKAQFWSKYPPAQLKKCSLYRTANSVDLKQLQPVVTFGSPEVHSVGDGDIEGPGSHPVGRNRSPLVQRGRRIGVH